MKGRVQLKDGMWYTIINYKDYNGDYKRKWQNTGLKERGNKKEATRMLEERLQEFEVVEKEKLERRKNRVTAREQPLGTAETRFVDYCKKYLEHTQNKYSLYVYQLYCKYYIRVYEEFFKDKAIIDITTEEIEKFYDYMRQKRGVKNNTLKHYAEVLRPTLKHAFKIDRIIPDNPYDYMQPLKVEKTTMSFYNQAELENLFEITKGHRLELAILMAAHYGFRRSELLGLRWQAVDFGHQTVTVNHKVLMLEDGFLLDDKLKSRASHRTLPLFHHLAEKLLKHKSKIAENRDFFGDTYNQKYTDYIFIDEMGELLKPTYVTKAFGKLIKKHLLKHIRFHDLRHSCASLLLANGINMKQIQDWLGHADFATTADRYVHLDFNSKIQSAEVISNAFVKKEEVIEKPQIHIENEIAELENFSARLVNDMEKLGFSSIDDYIRFLERVKKVQGFDAESFEKGSDMAM